VWRLDVRSEAVAVWIIDAAINSDATDIARRLPVLVLLVLVMVSTPGLVYEAKLLRVPGS
jgi:hypothetical protein